MNPAAKPTAQYVQPQEVKVYLVGAGPGDPALLTFRGREVLGQADVVVHDYPANPRLLPCVPRR